MKIQRFFALTAREALTQVREALGPDAIIISNRSIANGVEILASHEQDFTKAVEASHHAAASEQPTAYAVKEKEKVNPTPIPQQNNDSIDSETILEEIRSMRGSLESQLAKLSWFENQQRYPAKSGILRELLTLGFSASLSRYLAENAPVESGVEQGVQWAQKVLTRNLQVLKTEAEILDQGGVYALVGPTGVGKTTTTAKLAARCVMHHGSNKLALITTDSYRIGAHEQLRIYGKILGVMVHTVRDETDLKIALDELKKKHTVLIDTVGMSQRDQMVTEQIAMLSSVRTPIKRLLCLNATSTIETLNEVILAYRGSGLAGCIMTKLDEAVTISNALDAVLRHKLKLFYACTGQRVPEDMEVADADLLLERAFKRHPGSSVTRYKESELPILMAMEATHYPSDKSKSHVT